MRSRFEDIDSGHVTSAQEETESLLTGLLLLPLQKEGLTCACSAASPTGPCRLVEQGSKAHTLPQNKKAPLRGFLCSGGAASPERKMLSSPIAPVLADYQSYDVEPYFRKLDPTLLPGLGP